MTKAEFIRRHNDNTIATLDILEVRRYQKALRKGEPVQVYLEYLRFEGSDPFRRVVKLRLRYGTLQCKLEPQDAYSHCWHTIDISDLSLG